MERLTVGMLKKYLEGLDDNLTVVVYNPEEECDTFLYGAPTICGADDFNYCKADSVAYYEDEDTTYCYFGNRDFYRFDEDDED